jgi:hypothetical protein
VDGHVAPDEARLDAATDVRDAGALEDDGVLDLAAAHHDAVADGREGPDVGALEHRAPADDRRPPHRALGDARACLDHDLAGDVGVLDGAVRARRERIEDDPVGFEHVLELARILPPALDDVGPDDVPLVDEPLNGVRDLELATR